MEASNPMEVAGQASHSGVAERRRAAAARDFEPAPMVEAATQQGAPGVPASELPPQLVR